MFVSYKGAKFRSPATNTLFATALLGGSQQQQPRAQPGHHMARPRNAVIEVHPLLLPHTAHPFQRHNHRQHFLTHVPLGVAVLPTAIGTRNT